MPSLAQGNIIRVLDKQTYLGEQVLNVYFYRVVPAGTITIWDPIVDYFVDEVVPAVCGIQHAALTHTELFFENLTNGLDILSVPLTTGNVGLVSSGDASPPFVSYGFQLLRESRATRHGYKRIAGVPEVNISSGEVVSGAMPYVNAVADVLPADILIGLLPGFEPVIVKHPISVPLTDPVYASIGGCNFRGIGTQNTRKFGRGV